MLASFATEINSSDAIKAMTQVPTRPKAVDSPSSDCSNGRVPDPQRGAVAPPRSPRTVGRPRSCGEAAPLSRDGIAGRSVPMTEG